MKCFNGYLKENHGGKTLKERYEELGQESLIELLNDALRGYYQTMLVSKRIKNVNGETVIEDIAPKRKTAECSRSHLKKIILNVAKLDISGNDFSKFTVSSMILLTIFLF